MEHQVQQAGEYSGDAADPTAVEVEQSQAEQQAAEMVPVTALQAERRERQQLQEQMKMLQDHMSLMQANNTPQAPAQDENFGMADDDVLTVGEAKKFMSKLQTQYQTSVEEIRVQQKYPDYDKIVKEFLPDVIKVNPALRTTLENDPNRYELAYFLAKNSDSYREKNHTAKKSSDAERIVQNGMQAGNLSSMGSNAPTQQPSAYKNMSDSDFFALANKNRGYQ